MFLKDGWKEWVGGRRGRGGRRGGGFGSRGK